MMLTLFQSHSMSRLLTSTTSDDSSSTASSSSRSDDTLQPLKSTRSSSNSAEANSTTALPSLFNSRRTHRRSEILRTRSLELVKERRYSRARSIKKFKNKIIENFLGKVALTNQEIESSQASVQRRKRVQKLAAEKGRALNDTRELHRTISLVVKVAIRDNYERRAATVLLQAIARGYLIRKLLCLPQQASPPRRVEFHRQCSEITMSDFGGSIASLASFNDSVQDTSAMPSSRRGKFLAKKNHRREHPAPPLAPVRAPSFSKLNVEDDHEDEDSLCSSGIPSILKPIRERQHSSSPLRSSSLSSLFSHSTDDPSWNPNREKKISKGDEHPSYYNRLNDSVQDTSAMPPFRKDLLGKNNRSEHPAPPRAPVRWLQSISTINFEDDADEGYKEFLCSEDEEYVCSSIPPVLKKPRSESSFFSVFGARQDSDFPLARPSRSMSPMVSPVGTITSRSIGSSSLLNLSASIAEL